MSQIYIDKSPSLYLVENGEDARVVLQQAHAVGVVSVHDFRPRQRLLGVLFLNLPQEVLDEVLLQLFVGVVDAQLFEAVLREALEAVNVEDPCEKYSAASKNGEIFRDELLTYC